MLPLNDLLVQRYLIRVAGRKGAALVGRAQSCYGIPIRTLCWMRQLINSTIVVVPFLPANDVRQKYRVSAADLVASEFSL